MDKNSSQLILVREALVLGNGIIQKCKTLKLEKQKTRQIVEQLEAKSAIDKSLM